MINTESGRSRQDALSRIANTFSSGDFYQAEQIARQLYQADATDEEALHLLTQIIHRRGRPAEAIDLMSELIGLNPMHAPYHNDLGVMQASLGQWPEASAAYRMSIVLDPSGVDARFNLALALFRQADSAAALAVLDDLAGRAPAFAEQYALRGEILRAEKQHEAAAIAFSRALELGVNTADVYSQLGMALSDSGRKDDALTALLQAGQIDSDDPAANYYLGNLLREQGKFEAAVQHYRKALARRPDFPEVYNNLGLILQEQGDISGAEAAFAQALVLAPKLGAAHNNMGNWQIKQGHMQAALLCFRKAVEMTPDSPEAWNNLGETYYRLQRLDEAEEAYRKALAINPGCAEAGLNLGILLLLRGDFVAGWPSYEQRWAMPAVRDKRPRFAQPEWRGEALDGKALLIYVEQGMGDNLQFVRYLGVLRARYPGAKIYYWCLPPLFHLFSTYAAECDVELLPETVPGGLPPFDYQIALLTIPGRLGTTLETIPASVPYLKAPQNLADQWAERLAALPGKKIGLVWASGETYLFHKFRTMRLEQLSPLLQIPGVSWVSLQKGGGAAQLAEESWAGRIFDPMGEVDDFAGTAAIIANLDLVISVDTSVPHLAGAMGKPVWLLDRFDTDWRWLLGRNDSPWYPTMRIFRQTAFAHWDSVVPKVVGALAAWVSGEPERVLDDAQPLAADLALRAQAGPSPTPALKLNLGCGNRKMAGFVNVDCVAVCQPDMVVNLEATPWPWDDNSVDEIKLVHVLEHLGQSTEVFLAIVREMYRVCRAGARIEIIVPHPRHDSFLGDPTHVRPVTVQMLSLFDQRLNRQWAAVGAANTPLGVILEVDFEVETFVHALESDWQQKLSSGAISEAELAQAVRQYNNVIVQTTIVWRVHKGRQA